MGRSRGGLTTKIHAVVDGEGLPIRLILTAGQAHDYTVTDDLLQGLPDGAMLLADKAYDTDHIRARQVETGGWANIPPKSNRKDHLVFSPKLYGRRNLVERFFNKLKHFHRIATRYDKLAENFLAAVKLACIRLWPRAYESTT
jgi:transposase